MARKATTVAVSAEQARVIAVQALREAARELASADMMVAGKQAAFTAKYKTALDTGTDDKTCAKEAHDAFVAQCLNLTPERVAYLALSANVAERPKGWTTVAATARQRISRTRKALGIVAEHSEARAEAARGARQGDAAKAAEKAAEKAAKAVQATLPQEEVAYSVRQAQAMAYLDAVWKLLGEHVAKGTADKLQKQLEAIADLIAE